MPPLSEAQLAHFHTFGFCPLPDLFPPSVLQPLIAEFSQAIEDKAHSLHSAGVLTETYAGAPFDRRLALLSCAAADKPIVEQLWMLAEGKHMKTAGMFGILTHPPLLDVAASICGPEVLAHPQFNSRGKLPSRLTSGEFSGANQGATGVGWHQDSELLERSVDANCMANLWVPLVNSPVETGPLRVVPTSHRWGLLPHYPSVEQIDMAASAFASRQSAVSSSSSVSHSTWPALTPLQAARLQPGDQNRSDAYPGAGIRHMDLENEYVGTSAALDANSAGMLMPAEDVGGAHWRALDCPVPLGGALLIHERLLHCSTANITDTVRWSLDLRFCNADLPTGRDAVPGFLARSARRPEEVARSHVDWQRLFPNEKFDQRGLPVRGRL